MRRKPESLKGKLNHDRLLPDVLLQEPIGSGGSGKRKRFLERSPKILKALEGRMLVQAPSSQFTSIFIIPNQQPTGYSWSSSAGNPPTFGVPPSAPVGRLAYTQSGAAYNPFGAGTPAPTRGSTTNPYIAPPGTADAPASAGAPATAASFANAPVTPVPAPTGGFTTTNAYIAPPGAAYTPAVLGNVSQLLLQTDAPDPPSHPYKIYSAFNPWSLHLYPSPSNHILLQKESTSARSTTGSVPSSTPPRTSSPTKISKTLHRQPRTTALNQATFHTTRMTRTATPRKSPTTSPHFPINLPCDPANLTPPSSTALPSVPTATPNSPRPRSLHRLLDENSPPSKGPIHQSPQRLPHPFRPQPHPLRPQP